MVDPHLAGVFKRLILEWAARDPEGFDQRFEANAAIDGCGLGAGC